MFFKSYKRMHAKNKGNLRYVAAGNYQIEFFSLTGEEYFGIYSPYGGNNYCKCLPLGRASIATIRHGYQIQLGASTYQVRMGRDRKGCSLVFAHLLWGWFPLGYRGGRVSSNGIDIVHQNIKPYVDSVAA
ncbi:hypothetical protein [Spongiibacter tropicus]|uniref:hypothetical protein n=1 Tax=Spongiibacter tropicus TaxID=454602 RepID=UPI0035BE579C